MIKYKTFTSIIISGSASLHTQFFGRTFIGILKNHFLAHLEANKSPEVKGGVGK